MLSQNDRLQTNRTSHFQNQGNNTSRQNTYLTLQGGHGTNYRLQRGTYGNNNDHRFTF